MTDPRQVLGAAAEAFVAQWFEARGYEVLARNWLARGGELDVVLRRADLVVFVEVRSVSRRWLASPTVSVTPRKQARVATAADQFLRTHRLDPGRIRFDVAGVMPDGGQWRLELVENAFVPAWGF